ncbi:MAG: GHKL domain-containing protein [Proteobacteria bacterium]|nr:GHKL domain-containing protein [Pseudomonadota bacterium]
MEENNQKPRSPYYRSLMRRMVAVVIVVSFTPMILITWGFLYQFKILYHEKVYAHLEELVQKHQQNIDVFLKEKLADVKFLATNFSFDQLSNEQFLKQKLISLDKEHGPVITDLGIIDEKGIQLAYAGPFKLEKANYEAADWFRKSILSEYYISDVFLGLRGHPHFIIAVRNENEEQSWLLRATINFEAFNSLVENLRVGTTGFAFILNREGKFQTKPSINITETQAKGYLKEYMQLKDNRSITEESHLNGQPIIHVSSLLKNEEWLMIFQQNASDAFRDFIHARRIALVISFVGGCAIITMAFLMSRRMVKIIAKRDEENKMMNQQVIETGKLASIGELAAGIAHEINNPVAIMVEEAGWIEDLLEEEEFQNSKNMEEFRRALTQINTQGKRCKGITHKLLSFARKTDSRVHDVEVNALITEIVGISAQMAKYSNINIETEFEEGLPYIEISPSEMQQVLLNLINNAIYAMEKTGGTIKIGTKLSQLEKDHIVIIVEDNGPGIPESNLPRIFDPFFTTKPVGKGTGLGLSICYGIIQKMGGKIDVHSAVDSGTRFRIWIPFQKEDQQSTKHESNA